MPWQDIVFSVGSWIFIAALVPSIIGRYSKPALSTSVMTFVVMTLFAYTYVSLELFASAVSAGFLALAWLVLAIQKFRLNKNNETHGEKRLEE